MEKPENADVQKMLGVANELMRATLNMPMLERKTMLYFVSKIAWKNSNNPREIWVDKEDFIKAIELTGYDVNHKSYILRQLLKKTTADSMICFNGKDKDEWDDMYMFSRMKSTREQLMLKVNDDAMPLLEQLESGKYLTMYLEDIVNFSNDENGTRAFMLYKFLRQHADTRRKCTVTLTTKELKEMWGIPKDGKGSYMRDEKHGGFNRSGFEKKVIDPVFEELSSCKHIIIYPSENGKKYTKVRKNGRIAGYDVEFVVNMHPKKIEKETIIDVQEHPEDLKIAQDIRKGKKKETKPAPIKNRFTDFPQRHYTAEQMEAIKQKMMHRDDYDKQ